MKTQWAKNSQGNFRDKLKDLCYTISRHCKSTAIKTVVLIKNRTTEQCNIIDSPETKPQTYTLDL